MPRPISRRAFIGSTLSSAALIAGQPFHILGRHRRKLRIGVIGVHNRGRANLDGVAREDVIALCDVDENYLKGAAKRFPNAKLFRDYREMINIKSLEAVVVSTPDHHHAIAASRALSRGLDVYCEKPLAHTAPEARRLAVLARQNDRVTQMGTQIHAGTNYRRVVELVQGGAIGKVQEIHVFCNIKAWTAKSRPKVASPIPKNLDYDLWLGPAAHRPFHTSYHPAAWRRYWDFGGGTLADMGAHYMDLAFWAADLKYPTRVEAKGPTMDTYAAPPWLKVAMEFPDGPRVHWYDGSGRPKILNKFGLQKWSAGVFFLGESGKWIISGYSKHEMGPKEAFKDFKRPATSIPNSIGHHAEWIKACKERGSTTCAFNYSGPLTEALLLGVASYRAQSPLVWDAANMKVTNTKAADKFIHKTYREGWELK